MTVYRLLPFIAVTLVMTLKHPEARAQSQTKSQAILGQPDGQPKLIKSPVAPISDEARKKNIEGKVELTVVVDKIGRVLDAKVLSGPPELYQVAIDSVRDWEFEPPAHPPVETKVEINFGYPKE